MQPLSNSQSLSAIRAAEKIHLIRAEELVGLRMRNVSISVAVRESGCLATRRVCGSGVSQEPKE